MKIQIELTQQQLATIIIALDRHSENLLSVAKTVAEIGHPNETIRKDYSEIGDLIAHLNESNK
jgi:hypothetical protein